MSETENSRSPEKGHGPELNPLPDNSTRMVWQAPDDMTDRSIRDILRHELRCSGMTVQRLRQPGCVLVDGKPARVVDRMQGGSLLEIILTEPDDSSLVPEEIPIVILYEDAHLIAVDKTDLMAVHPSSIHRSGTLANAIAWHMAAQGRNQRVRPVTRLDRNTSGITLFAKTAHAQFDLARQSETGTFEKAYLGICLGRWEPASGTIRLPIRRKTTSIIERETHPDGDTSVTHYETVATIHLPTEDKNGLPCSLVRFILETGRTHQIRVHCLASGHPMLGDTLYGSPPWPGLAGQALHCDTLSFLHPVTREPVVLHSRRSSAMFRLPGMEKHAPQSEPQPVPQSAAQSANQPVPQPAYQPVPQPTPEPSQGE